MLSANDDRKIVINIDNDCHDKPMLVARETGGAGLPILNQPRAADLSVMSPGGPQVSSQPRVSYTVQQI